MASGCPVLVSKTSCLPEINGNAAYYFNPDKINSIERGINIILNKKNIYNKLRQYGFKRIKHFNIKDNFNKTLSLIDRNNTDNDLKNR